MARGDEVRCQSDAPEEVLREEPSAVEVAEQR
jgi:hypothetical protein